MSTSDTSNIDDTVASLAAQLEAKRAADNARTDRQLDLMERDVAVKERMVNAGALHHKIEGDDARDRMMAFFELPDDQQDFRLREESMGLAVRLCEGWGDAAKAIGCADQILNYIRDGS